MTINDLLKQVKQEDYDKEIFYEDAEGGWSSVVLYDDEKHVVLGIDPQDLLDD